MGVGTRTRTRLTLEAAALIASAVAYALVDTPPMEILENVRAVCSQDAFLSRLDSAAGLLTSGDAKPDAARKKLGNGIAATESVVTALYIALRFFDAPFGAMIRFIAEVGGDVDTIGAMAGANFGARNGAEVLPKDEIRRLEQSEHIEETAKALYRNRRKS